VEGFKKAVGAGLYQTGSNEDVVCSEQFGKLDGWLGANGGDVGKRGVRIPYECHGVTAEIKIQVQEVVDIESLFRVR